MNIRTVPAATLCVLVFLGLETQAELRELTNVGRGFSRADSASPEQASAVRREQLLADLKALSADDMEGRLVGSPGGAKARAYVIERFKATGLKPFGDSFESPFTFTGGRGAAAAERQGINIIGQVTGTKQPGRYIVVTAHYDHI